MVFSRGGIEVNRCCSVDFMIGLRFLNDVNDDLILCFLISTVCWGAKACDIILRIF